MSESPLFSVVIPTHNRPEFLAEAIDSVLHQTVQDFEVVVVDDASEPRVPQHHDQRVRVVRRDSPGGPAQARNDGVVAASGQYLVFLDDDDWFTPDRLAAARYGLTRAPVTLCWGGYQGEELAPGPDLSGFVHERLLNEGFCPGVVVAALRRDAWVPFDPSYRGSEDIDWWLRVTESSPVSTVPRHCYVVRRHDEVRVNHGWEAREAGSRSLLSGHPEYFKRHRKARGFRYRRIGYYSGRQGRVLSGLGWLARSGITWPTPRLIPDAIRMVRDAIVPGARDDDPSAEAGSSYYGSERRDMIPFLPACDSYLDIGCGEGRFGSLIKQRFPSAVVWGVEPDAEAVEKAQHSLDRVVHGSFPDCLSVSPSQRFDCVVCNDVLEHMVDPWNACRQIRSLLNPGGFLVVSIPNIRNFATLSELVARGRWDYVDAGVLDRTHLRFFTRATVIEMLEQAGLVVESVSGAWPLTTTKMRLVHLASLAVPHGFADEGQYRQFVFRARRDFGAPVPEPSPTTQTGQ